MVVGKWSNHCVEIIQWLLGNGPIIVWKLSNGCWEMVQSLCGNDPMVVGVIFAGPEVIIIGFTNAKKNAKNKKVILI